MQDTGAGSYFSIFLLLFTLSSVSRSQGAGPRDNLEVGPDGGARECKRNEDIQANGESGGEGIRGRQARHEETCTHRHCRDLGAASSLARSWELAGSEGDGWP